MRGFCTKCGRTFGDQMLCPNCGIQLQADTAGVTVPMSVAVADDSRDGPSFLRRLAFGLVTLFGVYQGLKHLALAAVLVQTGVPTLPPNSYLAVLIAATLAASIAAGTVNRRAEAAGLLLAFAASAGFLGPELWQGSLVPGEWPVGVPTLMVLIGVVGGFAGRMLVPPAPHLPTFGRLDSRTIRVQKKPVRIMWPQVAFGAAIAVAGTVYADAIRHTLSAVLNGGGGSFGARSLITWQVSTLAAIAGGLAAGFGSRAGLRQGVYAGVAAGAGVVLGVLSQQPAHPSPVVDFWVDQLNARGGGPLPFVALAVTTCIATALGGWVGRHVFPPAKRI